MCDYPTSSSSRICGTIPRWRREQKKKNAPPPPPPPPPPPAPPPLPSRPLRVRARSGAESHARRPSPNPEHPAVRLPPMATHASGHAFPQGCLLAALDAASPYSVMSTSAPVNTGGPTDTDASVRTLRGRITSRHPYACAMVMGRDEARLPTAIHQARTRGLRDPMGKPRP